MQKVRHYKHFPLYADSFSIIHVRRISSLQGLNSANNGFEQHEYQPKDMLQHLEQSHDVNSNRL